MISEQTNYLHSRGFGSFSDLEKIYEGIQYSTAVNSCTAALDLKQVDEVRTTPMTFCSTINTIIHAGLKPVLVDIDPISMNIDPMKIEEKIAKKQAI